jgi:hypothetical protein
VDLRAGRSLARAGAHRCDAIARDAKTRIVSACAIATDAGGALQIAVDFISAFVSFSASWFSAS